MAEPLEKATHELSLLRHLQPTPQPSAIWLCPYHSLTLLLTRSITALLLLCLILRHCWLPTWNPCLSWFFGNSLFGFFVFRLLWLLLFHSPLGLLFSQSSITFSSYPTYTTWAGSSTFLPSTTKIIISVRPFAYLLYPIHSRIILSIAFNITQIHSPYFTLLLLPTLFLISFWLLSLNIKSTLHNATDLKYNLDYSIPLIQTCLWCLLVWRITSKLLNTVLIQGSPHIRPKWPGPLSISLFPRFLYVVI